MSVHEQGLTVFPRCSGSDAQTPAYPSLSSQSPSPETSSSTGTSQSEFGSAPSPIYSPDMPDSQFPASDDNGLAVLTYAVHHLGVSHVVVTGHTQCGGAAACHAAANSATPADPPSTQLDRWLAPMIALAKELGGTPADLVEANVRAAVANIAATEVMKSAWASGKDVQVHGWVYEIEKGSLKDLRVTVDAKSA